MSALSALTAASRALAKAKSLDDVRGIRDKAEALRVYLKTQIDSHDLQQRAAEIKIRAERRAGELLAEIERKQTAGLKKGTAPSRHDGATGYRETLARAEIPETTARRWQAIATVPEDRFEAAFAEIRDRNAEITSAAMYRLARGLIRERRNSAMSARPEETGIVSALDSVIESGKRFGTIYADPPWRYGNQGTRAATDNHYPTMTVQELCALPVAEVASEQSHLHLWTTNAFLFDARLVLEAWGFEYKSCFVWVKPQMGIGNYWRVSHEFVLLGVRGALSFLDRSLMSWTQAKRGAHSVKPESVRALIERASPAPRLEMFGRRSAEGWIVLGNQVSRRLLEEAAL